MLQKVGKDGKYLQFITNWHQQANENLGLNLNAQKTKYMVIGKEQSPTGVLRLKNASLDKVQKITYLGQSLVYKGSLS